MPAKREELVAAVEADKRRAREVLAQARAASGKAVIDPHGVDITGRPSGVASHVSDRLNARQALGGIGSKPFFARVDVHYEGDDKPVSMLIGRDIPAGELVTDEWVLIPWESARTASVMDKPFGFEFTQPGRRPHYKPVSARVFTSGRFGGLLPTMADARYILESGEAAIVSEAELIRDGVLEELKPREKPYSAATTYGLGEIIELADADQRTAMHFPFGASILIEGPPGSGKTSIGIMRIPCLLYRERVWQEEGITEDELVGHSPQTIRVLVMNEEMEDYLDGLTKTLHIEGVEVRTFDDFLRQVCREAGTLRGQVGKRSPFLRV